MSRHAIRYCRYEDQVPATAVMLSVGNSVNKKSLLKALGEACRFPEHYGHNWDAAWDCLHDSDVAHLLLDMRRVESVDKQALKEFCSLINDAYDAWQLPELWLLQKWHKPERRQSVA